MQVIMDKVPSYLQPLQDEDYYYGTLHYDNETDSWIIEGEPAVCQMAKKLFPGADGRGRGICRFKSNKRTNGDLNWLMHRYPLKIIDKNKWEADYKNAVQHVKKRLEILKAPQKIKPNNTLFKGTLEKFQEEGHAFLHHNAPTLLADDTGLGKTVQALAWVSSINSFPGIIVVPTSIQKQWANMIRKFIAPQPVSDQMELFPHEEEEPTVHIIKGLRPYELPPAMFYIIHYGLLRGWKEYLPRFGFEFLIFDEIQELRHSGTEKYSSASLLAESVGDNVIGLSGTPIYGKGGEIYNVMNIIDYHCLGDWESFTREWCYGYGSDIVVDPEMLGQHLRREGLMLRRTKQDERPPVSRIVQEIDSDENILSKQMSHILHLIHKHDSSDNQLEKGRLKRQIGDYLRQATGVSKAPYVAKFVKMLLDAGEAVVLYGYHHDVYEIWANELKAYSPVFVTGRESSQEKEESKQKFINGDSNIIIISLRAAAGIDGLQARTSINVFGELDWSPGIHKQCEGRTDRIGQKNQCISYYLVCSEGSDEQMMEALGFKTSQFVGIMGEEIETAEHKEMSQIQVGKHLDRVIQKLREKQKAV